MRRKFANLGSEASIKNTLPSVNKNNENKQAIVPYKSRSGSIEINPQEEYSFEVSSSGKAIYYLKQERENLKTVGLYEDQDSPVPPTPVECAQITVVNNTPFDICVYQAEEEPIQPVDNKYSIPANVDTYFLIRDYGELIAMAHYTGTLRGDYADNNAYVLEDGVIQDPVSDINNWIFADGDEGTLVIDEYTITIDNTDNESYSVNIYDMTDDEYPELIVHVPPTSSGNLQITPGTEYLIIYNDQTEVPASFSGRYEGSDYTVNLSINIDYGDGTICNPTYIEGYGHWVFSDGDYGIIKTNHSI